MAWRPYQTMSHSLCPAVNALRLSRRKTYQVHSAAAFDHGESSKKTGGEQNGSTAPPAGTGNEKWVSNYVPFGDFPKGNNAQ